MKIELNIKKVVIVKGHGHLERITLELENFKVTNYADPQYNSATLSVDCTPGKAFDFAKENFGIDEKDIEVIDVSKLPGR